MRRGLAALVVVLTAATAHAQNIRLEFAGKPRLIDCDGEACFRIDVRGVDAQGQPVTLDDKTRFAVAQADADLDVVQQQAVSRGPTRAPVRRSFFILFDTSGSMNERLTGGETKYTIARRQLERLSDTMQEGVDQIAIAPFDSQHVVDRIRAADFQSTRAGVRRQIAKLQPNQHGNTALFTAVYEALKILQPRAREDSQISLIVFTDGQNDVNHRNDDRGLLTGESGLRAVTDLAQDVGITIYTIGYGMPGATSFDEAALQALKYPTTASNYFNARDEARLRQIFDAIVRRSATGVRLLVTRLPQRREQLSGQSITFRVTNGQLSGESPAWQGNPLMTPPFEGALTPEERKAWILYKARPSDGARPTPWPPYLIRLLVLIFYSAALAALWFGLPRLIWPERYIPKPAFRTPAARAPQRPGPMPARPGAPPSRAPQPQRPEVTIASPRPPAGRPAGAPPPRPAADRPPPGPPPPRMREPANAPSAAPPRPREPWAGGQREANDATVFIPPSKKP